MKNVSIFLGMGLVFFLSYVFYNANFKDPCESSFKRISVAENAASQLPSIDANCAYKHRVREFNTQYSTSNIKKPQKSSTSISTTAKRGSILDRF